MNNGSRPEPMQCSGMGQLDPTSTSHNRSLTLCAKKLTPLGKSAPNQCAKSCDLAAEHKLGGNWALGGELMTHKFPSMNGTGGTLTATSISPFATHRF